MHRRVELIRLLGDPSPQRRVRLPPRDGRRPRRGHVLVRRRRVARQRRHIDAPPLPHPVHSISLPRSFQSVNPHDVTLEQWCLRIVTATRPGVARPSTAPVLRAHARPDDYKALLQESDGLEGFISADAYVSLWAAADLASLNDAYAVVEFVPDVTLLGTDGGGTGYGHRNVGGRFAMDWLHSSARHRQRVHSPKRCSRPRAAP